MRAPGYFTGLKSSSKSQNFVRVDYRSREVGALSGAAQEKPDKEMILRLENKRTPHCPISLMNASVSELYLFSFTTFPPTTQGFVKCGSPAEA